VEFLIALVEIEQRRLMRTFMAQCLIICMIGGCTTLQPIANAPSDLSQHFGDGASCNPEIV
jgi:hypothetical protein